MAKYKTHLLWLVIIVVLVLAFSNFGPNHGEGSNISYSQFLSKVENGKITSVNIQGQNIRARVQMIRLRNLFANARSLLIGELIKQKVNVAGEPPAQRGLFSQMLISWLPFIILFGVYFYFMRQMQGGRRGGPMSFGRSKAKLLTEDQIKVNFKMLLAVKKPSRSG